MRQVQIPPLKWPLGYSPIHHSELRGIAVRVSHQPKIREREPLGQSHRVCRGVGEGVCENRYSINQLIWVCRSLDL